MEKIDVNVVKFEVKVEAEKFNEALTRAYKKNVKHFNVPGFRKGKVPMNMVKKWKNHLLCKNYMRHVMFALHLIQTDILHCIACPKALPDPQT